MLSKRQSVSSAAPIPLYSRVRQIRGKRGLDLNYQRKESQNHEKKVISTSAADTEGEGAELERHLGRRMLKSTSAELPCDQWYLLFHIQSLYQVPSFDSISVEASISKAISR